MSISPSSHARNVSLDELIALADEMAALARAGVPLEHGLLDAARDISGRNGMLATDVARRLQSGESLLHVISSSPGMFPPAYRAIVEAGTRTGRLPSALEGLASSARRAADLRRLTTAAIVYPLLVALLAYGLFVFSIARFQPLVYNAYQTLNVPPNRLNQALVDLGRTATIWVLWCRSLFFHHLAHGGIGLADPWRRTDSGHAHPDAPAGWRYLNDERWLVFLQPHPDGIKVMRVVDSVRELPRHLRGL